MECFCFVVLVCHECEVFLMEKFGGVADPVVLRWSEQWVAA